MAATIKYHGRLEAHYKGTTSEVRHTSDTPVLETALAASTFPTPGPMGARQLHLTLPSFPVPASTMPLSLWHASQTDWRRHAASVDCAARLIESKDADRHSTLRALGIHTILTWPLSSPTPEPARLIGQPRTHG